MRRLILIIGMLALGGCASLPAPEVRRERIARWFKELFTSDGSSHSYQDESPESKAHHEKTLINELNGWIGNHP
jgi:hypothetical protein